MGESGVSWKEQFHVMSIKKIQTKGHARTTPQLLMPGRAKSGIIFQH